MEDHEVRIKYLEERWGWQMNLTDELKAENRRMRTALKNIAYRAKSSDLMTHAQEMGRDPHKEIERAYTEIKQVALDALVHDGQPQRNKILRLDCFLFSS